MTSAVRPSDSHEYTKFSCTIWVGCEQREKSSFKKRPLHLKPYNTYVAVVQLLCAALFNTYLQRQLTPSNVIGSSGLGTRFTVRWLRSPWTATNVSIINRSMPTRLITPQPRWKSVMFYHRKHVRFRLGYKKIIIIILTIFFFKVWLLKIYQTLNIFTRIVP